ncbi:ethanolamine ammonia-lyase subunit EutC [Planctomyces sp. SH-PL62]|uniref:ethanolamine ammonia-lyase subunit EutC n=1 Tax=Planctomyces sp. SH-PL62 TaxID=1636152 RepID=UPI00078B355B|nr:ethanolamine ammonia-lyase subunit EutC [Planctomyces sp. SH-PL62]AMV39715.1 Ethanolamine ammonia-lyase light chain [Planctomyces sp. SH-PL62]
MSDLLPDRPEPDSDDLLARVRLRTPARVLTGRAGGSYKTATWLELRGDHAAARDAVRADVDLERDFGRPFLDRWDLFEVATAAGSKAEYLLRPDLGRSLRPEARAEVAARRAIGADLQIVLGDGLSAAALIAQTPGLLPRLAEESSTARLGLGLPFFVRHCRVGVMNDVGDLLDPAVVILLIGERPGLATAESLSAYLAFRPRSGHDDSRRNLISNIHARGIPIDQAAARIVDLARRMIAGRVSGVAIKETWSPSLSGPAKRSIEPS